MKWTELPETANFCLKCGQRLTVGTPPPRPGPIRETERKRVTALFGVPMAHVDDPVRTILASLEIHLFVDALSPRYEMKVGRAQ
ncbi:MAG: hypothetical protein HN366_05840 [Deltaproteobacteria bacterium]|jgi:hypothetical protein|nr:hypothetical protein [Deltaproteobacteria bacterium]